MNTTPNEATLARHWLHDLGNEYCHQLTREELTDSPLARLAVANGYPSLTSMLNEWNTWGCTVGEIHAMLPSVEEVA